MLDLYRLGGIAWYEFTMRLRSWLYWIVFLLGSALSLFTPTPVNYPGLEDAPRFYSDWWLAGQAFSGLNLLMTLLAAFVVADCILRDTDFRTKELIQARPLSEFEYVFGKYLASLVSLGMIAVPALIGTPLIKRALLGVSMNPLPLFAAFVTIYLPSMAFVAALAMAVTTLIQNKLLFYGFFAILWYFDSMFFRVAHSLVRGILNFSGTSPFQAFFSSTALGFSTGDPPQLPASAAILNIGVIVIASILLLMLLVRLEKLRRGQSFILKSRSIGG